MREGRIVGAITVGDWENLDRVREAIEQPRVVSFWDMRRFRSTGNLWLKSESPPIADWPPDAIVCGCLRVNRGTLSLAQLDGVRDRGRALRPHRRRDDVRLVQAALAELLGGDTGPPSTVNSTVPRDSVLPSTLRREPPSRTARAVTSPELAAQPRAPAAGGAQPRARAGVGAIAAPHDGAVARRGAARSLHADAAGRAAADGAADRADDEGLAVDHAATGGGRSRQGGLRAALAARLVPPPVQGRRKSARSCSSSPRSTRSPGSTRSTTSRRRSARPRTTRPASWWRIPRRRGARSNLRSRSSSSPRRLAPARTREHGLPARARDARRERVEQIALQAVS